MAELSNVRDVIARAEIEKLKRQVESLKNRIPVDPLPGPPELNPILGQIDYSAEVSIAELYKDLVMSGDPDGAPADTIREVMKSFISIYQTSANRVQMELNQYTSKTAR